MKLNFISSLPSLPRCWAGPKFQLSNHKIGFSGDQPPSRSHLEVHCDSPYPLRSPHSPSVHSCWASNSQPAFMSLPSGFLLPEVGLLSRQQAGGSGIQTHANREAMWCVPVSHSEWTQSQNPLFLVQAAVLARWLHDIGSNNQSGMVPGWEETVGDDGHRVGKLLCVIIIINNDSNSEVQAEWFSPEDTRSLIRVAMHSFITSVVYVPREHMPSLLIIHLSSDIILDLVVISEFIYL